MDVSCDAAYCPLSFCQIRKSAGVESQCLAGKEQYRLSRLLFKWERNWHDEDSARL